MSPARRVLLVSLLLGVAGCGGGEPDAPADPFVAVESRTKADEQRAKSRAAPRWERVTLVRGDGPGAREVEIARDAVQWRVRWRCEGARFAVRAARDIIGRGDCGRPESAGGTGRGPIGLRVEADGDWRMVVEQQVTTPLIEPPPPGLDAPGARVVAHGRFGAIERRGSGRAIVYRRADGRLALRLEDFATAANTDLAVWLSPARAPRTTREVLGRSHVKAADLKATIGDQNYLLPRGTELARLRSVVIWCEPVRIAYTAAPLSR